MLHKAWRFIRRIFIASNAIQTIDNETAYLIIYCLNCIRRDGDSTYKTGLTTRYFVEEIKAVIKRSQHRATVLGQQCCTMLDENFKQL